MGTPKSMLKFYQILIVSLGKISNIVPFFFFFVKEIRSRRSVSESSKHIAHNP